MNAIEKIIADLNEVLKDFDAANAQKAREWSAGRKAAIADYRSKHCVFKDGDKIRQDQHTFYNNLFAAAGGKTWYNIFNGRNQAMVDEIMDNNSAAIVAKRNALIAKKLSGLNVTSVGAVKAAFHDGGVDCSISLETDKGTRYVSIDTIVAGGYNIQCLHNRTLVKVR